MCCSYLLFLGGKAAFPGDSALHVVKDVGRAQVPVLLDVQYVGCFLYLALCFWELTIL